MKSYSFNYSNLFIFIDILYKKILIYLYRKIITEIVL